MEVRFFAGGNKNVMRAPVKRGARSRRGKLAPCKKAESNHDQARIWASKVRVRTQLRTRNAITRVSNPLVHARLAPRSLSP